MAAYQVADPKPLMTVDEFRSLAGASVAADDGRVAAAIAAVSEQIRAWCGWHVAPPCECVWEGEGEGRIAVLPVAAVSAVKSVRVFGEPVEFEWKRAGIVRLKSGRFPDAWGSVTCEFTAGYPPEAVAQVCASMTAAALAASHGISEEHAGSVGITYNKADALLSRYADQLTPLRLGWSA